MARAALERAQRALQMAQRNYLALKSRREEYALFRYRTIYDTLQAARKDFDLFASLDPAHGAKVVGDRLQTTKGKGKSRSIGSSLRISGSNRKRPAADAQGDAPSAKRFQRSNRAPLLRIM